MPQSQTPRIWLCDLTYTQQTVSSDIMPAGVGGIATFTEQYLAVPVETRVFKLPDRLIAALEAGPLPHVIGFSNYVWNHALGTAFARLIKKRWPDIVTVFGGPNYPTRADEQEAFLRAHPMIDFYVLWDGEIPFARLVEALIANGFDPATAPEDLPSLHRILPDGRFLPAELSARLLDLTQIPSPYLAGKMDEFFDGVLLPIIQTKRGCPFTCTFCVEGNSYYTKVAKTALEKTEADIRYICARMGELIAKGSSRTDFHIADSNFGMFADDLKVCEIIAEMQHTYGYPEYINVATGKNRKERVLEAARLINGALRLSGAVQSLDPEVLKNIKRGNIDAKGLMALALEADAIGANSYSEIILGLPGDTLEAHFNTIKTIIEADFNNLCLYQLMLLPGTDLASPESKERWRMRTRYRILPRAFGFFEMAGEEIIAAEIEEICVSNDALSLDDYFNCRRFHLIVNVFYNDGVFKEALRLLPLLGLSKYDWMERIYQYRDSAEFNAFTTAFLDETRQELWEDRAALEAFVGNRKNLEGYLSGDHGANLIFKYRSLALVDHVRTLAAVAAATLCDLLTDAGQTGAIDFALELVDYARLRMTDVFRDQDRVHEAVFRYDVDGFAHDLKPTGWQRYELPQPRRLVFTMAPEQRRTLYNFTQIYGDSVVGLTRILAKIYVRRLFREVSEQATPRQLMACEAARTDLHAGLSA